MFLLAFAESIQLFPDGTLFIHIALILLMIWVLNRTFFRPINAVVASRDRFQGGHNIEAEEILKSAAEKQAKYSSEILAARTEGYSAIENERGQALAIRAEQVAAAKAAVSTTLESERNELRTQAEAARVGIVKEAETLAERIASNILKA